MDLVVSARTILEQSEQSGHDAETINEEKSSRHRRNLDLAFKHAFVIQHRKDVEAQILLSIEELTDVPESSIPTAAELEKTKTLLATFQPSDLEDLVAERVSQSHCGYVLCDREPRKRSWSIGADIAQFCSESCLRKTASISNQLSTVPAWERTSAHAPILLDATAEQMTAKVDARAELALERGEAQSSRKPEQVMTATIIEKASVSPLNVPSPPMDTDHDAVEGYVPRRKHDEDAMLADLNPSQASQSALAPDAEDHDDEEQQFQDMFEHLRQFGMTSR